MTASEILDAARVTGTKGVFILGCLEQRVTVYAQQVRALNLVDAMLLQQVVRNEGGKVAIIGGGVAGITAAVAFAKAAPNLAQLDLFESRSGILQLQRSSRRFLHPHFYDWPAPEANQGDAGLPIMNWQAGPAGDVAKALTAEFERTVGSSRLTLHTDHEVVELKPSDRGPVRVTTRNGTAANRIYDAVILAIGFGIERFLGSQTSSYWTPSELSGPILANVRDPLIFISGNGDGGLVDFLTAAFDSLEHSEICDLLGQNLGPAMTEIEAIEREAWAAGPEVDLLREYRARVRDLVPPAVWAQIGERLRPNVRICLHTREPRLLRRATALSNRLTTFLVLEADADLAIGHNAITVQVGVDFDGAPPQTGVVTLASGLSFEPFKRVLRLGPDAEANLTPFATLLGSHRAALAAVELVTPPSTPKLTATALERFEPHRVLTDTVTVLPMRLIAARAGAKSVTVTLAMAGRLMWAGDIGLGDIHLLWADDSIVDFYCDLDASDASRLLPAIARIGAHAKDFTLFTRDVVRWRSALENLWSDRSHPGPNISLHCPIEEWRDPPVADQLAEGPIGEFADTIHLQLDADTLNTIHQALFNVLGPPGVPTGWLVEPALREQLWELWQTWKAALALDAGKRRRFLRLLASVYDRVEVEEAALVRVGPKIVSRHLTMPTIFALAFAACSGRPVAPAGQHPGNVAVDALTGHTCGVEWIERRAIRGGIVGQVAWTTSIVLLSELSEAVQLMESDLRLDQVLSDPPKVGVPSLSDRPIVIGADGVFLSALEEGSSAVQRFFQSIFQRRADAARQTLEEFDDGNA